MSAIQALLSCLDDYIDNMSVPAADALEAIFLSIKEGRVEEFLPFMKGDEDANRSLLETFTQNFKADPVAFEALLLESCTDMRAEYLNTARRKLDSLTGFVLIDTVERTQAEKINLLADTNNQLLHLSVAYAFVSRLPDGLNRANRLSEWSIKMPSSEQADAYLSEACNCFLFGLDTACVVMCRSLLEEVLERKLTTSFLMANATSRVQRGWQLGPLLSAIHKDLVGSGINRSVYDSMSKVNAIASAAAHQNPVNPRVALECLKLTRAAIVYIL